MSGFKRSQPGLRFSGEKISPDEFDGYETYTWSQLGTANSWWGTVAVSGTSDTKAIGVVNRLPDTPRNFFFSVLGSNGTTLGTLTVNGFDQFGSAVSETIAISGTNSNGGTKVGTQVFAQFTSGTVQYGTYAGNGTVSIGLVIGTNCLLGLPIKLGGTTDVVLLSQTAGTGPISFNGGTIGAFVNVTQSAIRPAATLTGSETINVWVKPSFSPDNIPVVANLKQAV